MSPDKRHSLIVVGAATAAGTAIVCAAIVYLGGKSGALRLFKRDLAMVVCRGDSRQTCGTEHWIDCETDPVAFMKRVRPDVCVNVQADKVSERAGGKCGYTTFELKCSR
jgi:hypothetical protein